MGLRLITVFLQPNYVRDYKMEMYRESYMQHMKVLEGKLNDDKIAYISDQNRKIRELMNQDTSVDKYKNGQISEAEFNEHYRLRNEGSRQQDEFSVINERYQSVSNNPDRVYFIYSNGWTALIGNENLDFVLLILLMLIIVPMICNEFTTEMYPILRTTPNGGVRLYLSKFTVGIITATLIAFLFFIEEYIYFDAMFGLPSGSFPLQSLAPFEASPYQISIYGAAALTLVNSCIAAMFITALLMCLSAIFKRSLSAIFIGMSSILLPFVLFSESTMKYLLPTPLGFFLSSGFLKGYFPITPFSEKYVSITPKQYAITIIISVVSMVLLLFIGMIAFSGKKLCRKKAMAWLLCIPFMILTGCGEKTYEPDFSGFVYDKWSYRPVADEFSVARDENNIVCILYTNDDTPQPLIHDCFKKQDDYTLATMPFIDGKTIYYLNQYWRCHYEIIALDTNDFSERSVHEVEWSDNTEEMDMLFGLGFYLPKKMPQDEAVDSFFIHDNQLFISKSHGIYWYDLNDNKQICIYDKKSDNLAFSCNSVYYTDETLDVYRYNVKTKETTKLDIGKTERIYAVENGVICKNLLDEEFYFVNYDGSSKKPFSNFNEEHYLKENES